MWEKKGTSGEGKRTMQKDEMNPNNPTTFPKFDWPSNLKG